MPNPPRRRAAPSKKRRSSGNGLSTVGLIFAVVIAGLGIGALVSAFVHRGDERLADVPAPQATPVVQRTPTPLPVIVPTATATPYRKPTPTPKPPPTPTFAPTEPPTPSAEPTVSPTAGATANATAMRVVGAQTAAPVRTPAHVATAPPTHAPTAAPTRAPTAAPTRTTAAGIPSYARPAAASAAATVAPQRVAAAPAASALEDSGFAQRAAVVVRRYLSDVIGGKSDAASGLLDPSSNGVAEASVLGSGARIVDVHASTTGTTTAHVEVDLATAKGAYFATYDVSQTPAGVRIMNHEIIKP